LKFHYLAAPVQVISSNGKLKGIECIRMRLGEYDASGRRKPVPVTGSEFFVLADSVISAIGQKADLSFLPASIKRTEWNTIWVNPKTLATSEERTEWNTIWVNPKTLATSEERVFAGGDVVMGPVTVIDAIASGEKAAISIDLYLKGKPLYLSPKIRKKDFELLEFFEIEPSPEKRIKMPSLSVPERIKGFKEVELGLDEDEAVREARRCLRCDIEKVRNK